MGFDELLDPNPPEPGMREFAMVAERAQSIRRRRATWAVRAASLALVASAIGGFIVMSSRPETTPSGPPVTTRSPEPTVAEPSTASTVSLEGAQSASALPPVALGPGLLTISDDPLVEIFEATDGSTCTQAAVKVSTPECAPAGSGFVVIDYGEGDGQRVAVVVDPTINVSFDDASAECSQTFPDFAVVQVFVCTGLDLDAATVEVPSPDRIVIHP